MALALALLAASGLLVVTAPGSAEAVSCAGRKVRTLPFSTGHVDVYKRGGYVCAVTVAKKQGTRKWMSASVQARGNRPVLREGKRKDRIGTGAVHAGRRCVWVKGAVGNGGTSSGWILC